MSDPPGSTRDQTLVVYGEDPGADLAPRVDLLHDCRNGRDGERVAVRRSQTWPAILGRILQDWRRGVRVVSVGESRLTTATAMARLEGDVRRHRPGHVLICLARANALQGSGVTDFLGGLRGIVATLSDWGAMPVLMTPAPAGAGGPSHECARLVRQLAGHRGLPLIDLHSFVSDSPLVREHLSSDGVPDAVAHAAMAGFVSAGVLPLLGVDDFPNPVLCGFRKVYSHAEHDDRHCAFTDLTAFEGRFYLAFRRGRSHGNPQLPGVEVEVVLRSEDAVHWEEEAILQVPGFDNRDPKFLHVGDRLFLYGMMTRIPSVEGQAGSVTCGFQRLGPGRWSEPFECSESLFWRPRRWGDRYAVAAYRWRSSGAAVRLATSRDGLVWEPGEDVFAADTGCNETELWVEGDRLTAFGRSDGPRGEMLVAIREPDSGRWECATSGRLIHAPHVFEAGGRLMLSGRYCSYGEDRYRELQRDWRDFTSGDAALETRADPARVEEYHHGLRTGVFAMDGPTPRLVLELPSAGDSSYTGTVWDGSDILMSDYSMHEYYGPIRRPGDWSTPSDIYVSRLRFA